MNTNLREGSLSQSSGGSWPATWQAEVAALAVLCMAMIKFEAGYCMVKGQSVNHSAGFGDIFGDVAFFIFIACPLVVLTQMLSLPFLRSLPNRNLGLGLKVALWGCAIMAANFRKLFAEFRTMSNGSAFLFVVVATALYALYLFSLQRTVRPGTMQSWLVPAGVGVAGVAVVFLM